MPAAHSDRARHQWPGDRDHKPFPPAGAPEPGLELGRNGKDRCDDEVEPDRVNPEAAETQKARGHDVKLDGAERRVISRSADPAVPKDQPVG